jgi:myo-inositol-1(or 4)-monophosphatase
MKESLIEIVKHAGELLLKDFGKAHVIKKFKTKGAYDYSIVADMLVEKEILKMLKETRLRCKVLTEEGGEINFGNSGKLLFIDPLDGSLNYSKSIPHFCVSIALKEGDEITLGIIYDPCRKELFLAEKNKGAFLNEEKIKVNKCKSLKNSFCAMGFDYENFKRSMTIEEKIRKAVKRVRSFGSAGLELSWVACGRLEGYVDLDLKPWDLAAGSLLVEEAGGKVTDLKGHAWHPYCKEIVATNRVIHKKLLKVVNE